MKPASCATTKRGQMILKHITWNVIRRLQTSSTASPEIKIPNRIERSPTDILRALEKTITRDPTAAHYKFHDDPYLTPRSSIQSRSFALSRESGRKAAMWVRQEHADLFQHKVADPEIPSFYPSPTYTDKSQVSEEILVSVISKRDVKQAINIYHLLQGDVSTKTKQSFLELLCFYNSEENAYYSGEFLEEQWFRGYTKNYKNTWRHNADITTLFESLKAEDEMTAAAAYNTMICGLAKYMNAQQAWKLYEECLEKKIPLNVHTYNSVLSIINLLTDENSLKNSVINILKLMAENKVRPNIYTLNTAIKVASTVPNVKMAKDFMNSLISEFRRLNVEPSLASYCYVLLMHYHREKNPSGEILSQILHELKNKKLAIQDQKDILFFPTAMEVAAQILHDGDMGQKVHELLLLDDNYKFISSNYVENLYYKMFMILKIKTEPLEEFMKFYDDIVPNVYIPEADVISELLDSFCLSSPEIVKNNLAKIWSHMVMFNFVEMRYLTKKLFSLMHRHFDSSSPDSALNKQFVEAAASAWEYLQEKRARKLKPQQLYGETLGHLAILLLRGHRLEEMVNVVSFTLKEEGSVIGTMQDEQINELLAGCLLNGHSRAAILILQYAANSDSNQLETMARKVYQTLPLTASEESKISTIVGSDVYKTEASSSES